MKQIPPAVQQGNLIEIRYFLAVETNFGGTLTTNKTPFTIVPRENPDSQGFQPGESFAAEDFGEMEIQVTKL